MGIGFQTWDLECSAAVMWCPVCACRNSKWGFVLLGLWLAVWMDKSIQHINQFSASQINFSLSWNLLSFLTCSRLIFDWSFIPFCGSLLLLCSCFLEWFKNCPKRVCTARCLPSCSCAAPHCMAVAPAQHDSMHSRGPQLGLVLPTS